MTSDTAKLTPLKRFFRLLQVDRKDIFYIYVYALFSGLVNLTLPLGIQAIINLLFGGQISTSWILLVAIVIIGVAFTGGLQIMQLTISERLQQRIFTRAAVEFAYRIPRIKLEALRNQYAPELVNRFFDTLSVQKGLSKILIDFSTSTLQVLFGLALLSFYHPFFVIFSFALVILVYLIIRLSGPTGMRSSLIESKHKYELVHWLEEVARTMATFKLAGDTDLPTRKTDKLVSNYLKARKRHFGILVLQYSGMIFFKVVVVAGLLVIGGLLVIEQEMNIGQFVAAEIIIILIMTSVEKLVMSMETIYDVLTALEKIGTVTDLELEDETGKSVIKDNVGKGISISLNEVSYKQNDDEGNILDKISLTIASGEHVCIAGYNGSGKSSLLQIISGLYTEFSGSITYNDIPLPNINIRDLRSHIGDNLSQEDLFVGSIEENINMGRDDISFDDVLEACRQTNLLDFIQKLPAGFNTLVGPEGRTLPKSIVRKIILARSFAESPRLLVIEDDFVQLQKNDKKQILKRMLDKSNSWTMVMISNDPDIAMQFDKTIVLSEGKVLAQGKLDTLIGNEWFNEIFYK